MTQLASLSRLGLLSTFAVVLAAACGGQSFTGGDGDAGSSSTAGKTGQGGSTSHAGKTSTAGTNQAGFGSTGTTGGTGSSGTTGTAGAGGAVPWNEACDAMPDSGNCEAAISSWFHDRSTGLCMPFTYGGCGGNANRYGSFADCQKACPGGNPNYDACKSPSDCLVTGPGCCGICDGPGISARDLIAYNRAYANQLQCGRAFGIAGDPGAGAAAPIACAPCLPVADGTLKNFIPNCVDNQCAVEDIRTSAATACKTAVDCKLRNGTSCCEGCGSGSLVAVRKDGSFEKLVCGGEPVACDACAPTPTPGAIAICGASGHCEVAYPVNTGG
jgi:hypothetical protein